MGCAQLQPIAPSIIGYLKVSLLYKCNDEGPLGERKTFPQDLPQNLSNKDV